VLAAGDMATLPELSTCSAIGRAPGPDAIDAADVLVLEDRLARAATLAQFGQLPEALELASSAVERADVLGSVDLAARARLVVGRTLRLTGRPEEGERVLGEALVAADGANEDVTATHAMVWLADAILVRDGHDPRRQAEARRWLELAADRVARLPAAGPLRSLVDGELGELRQATGDYEGAVRLFREAIAQREASLGPGHPLTASAHDALGGALSGAGRSDEGLAEFERGLALREAAFGPHHPAVARSLNNIATIFENDGRAAEAVPLFERALEIDEEVLGEEHTNWATKASNLGYAYLRLGEPGEALVMFERAIASQDRMPEPLAQAMVLSRKGRAIALRELGRRGEALVQFLDAIELARARWGADTPGLRDLHAEFDRTRLGGEPR
jgi:eukaryotic-like serine/threonine-protein kinase